MDRQGLVTTPPPVLYRLRRTGSIPIRERLPAANGAPFHPPPPCIMHPYRRPTWPSDRATPPAAASPRGGSCAEPGARRIECRENGTCVQERRQLQYCLPVVVPPRGITPQGPPSVSPPLFRPHSRTHRACAYTHHVLCGLHVCSVCSG